MVNEKWLIDVTEENINEVLKGVPYYPDEIWKFTAMTRRFRKVDAVEVVHGKWEPVDHDGSWRVDMCSICHRRVHYVDYDQPYPYCPNCGARMDMED